MPAPWVVPDVGDVGYAVALELLVGLNRASVNVCKSPATRALEQVRVRDYVHVMTTQNLR
jgi:hypothetical protein